MCECEREQCFVWHNTRNTRETCTVCDFVRYRVVNGSENRRVILSWMGGGENIRQKKNYHNKLIKDVWKSIRLDVWLAQIHSSFVVLSQVPQQLTFKSLVGWYVHFLRNVCGRKWRFIMISWHVKIAICRCQGNHAIQNISTSIFHHHHVTAAVSRRLHYCWHGWCYGWLVWCHRGWHWERGDGKQCNFMIKNVHKSTINYYEWRQMSQCPGSSHSHSVLIKQLRLSTYESSRSPTSAATRKVQLS